jgi:hypothetical protein
VATRARLRVGRFVLGTVSAVLLIPLASPAAGATRSLRVLDAMAAEDSGTLSFSVRLSRKAGRKVQVLYETRTATATAGSDFEDRAGSLRFKPGQRRKTVRVALITDAVDEPDETLRVKLSEPSRATLADKVGIGTIVDDDAPNLPDSCLLQFPTAVMVSSGNTVEVFGRVREAGLTDQPDANDPSITSQVGYGPDGSDPGADPGWTFVAAGPNAGYGVGSPDFDSDFDEHIGSFVAPAPGTYDYAYRFSLDGGNSYAYCDALAGSSDGYSPANAGQMTVQP